MAWFRSGLVGVGVRVRVKVRVEAGLGAGLRVELEIVVAPSTIDEASGSEVTTLKVPGSSSIARGFHVPGRAHRGGQRG